MASSPDGCLPHRLARRTVAYSWHTQQPLVEWALENGFAGYLSKALPIRDLVSALEALSTEDGLATGPEPALLRTVATRGRPCASSGRTTHA